MKKRISLLLAFVITLSSVEVMAEKAIEAVSEVIPEIELVSNDDAAQTLEEAEEPPEVHTEIIPADYVYPFETDLEGDSLNMRAPLTEDSGIMTFSTTSSNTKTLWDVALIEQFSEEYLMPLREKGGEQVSGNTNRLTYRVTDLSLDGKNGLNVNVVRKFDTQNYDEIYYLSGDDSIYSNVLLYYVYTFTDDEGEEVKIGFYSEDEYYRYMYGGAYISEYPDDLVTGGSVNFYDFNDIYDKIIDEADNIWLEPDESHTFVDEDIEISSVNKHFVSRRLRARFHSIGGGWEYELPYVVAVQDSKTKYKEDDYDEWETYNSGVFSDLDGNIHSFSNEVWYAEYDDGSRTYSAYFENDDDYIEYTSYYMLQTLEPYGIEYNMKAYDPFNAITYYFYNTNGVVSSKSNCRIAAIVDEFGNAIRYAYNAEDDNLCKITDTYGREIYLRDSGVTYTEPASEQTYNISYNLETLPSSALDNGSILTGKDVYRLSVTNELGETTVYDSRQSEVTSSLISTSRAEFTSDRGNLSETTETSLSYNLERIAYPNGKETYYDYKNFYYGIYDTGVLKSVYALSERYDVIDGERVNSVEYEFEEEAAHKITGRRTNGYYTESDFDEYGMKLSVASKDESGTIQRESYTYDDEDRLKSVYSNNRGLTKTTSYTYYTRHKIESQLDDDKKIEYTYSGKGNTPETEKYSYADGNNYIEDYTVHTTKLGDTGKVEYEKVIKDDEIKSQVKYEYDDEGNVTAIYTWTKDLDANGILDLEDEYVVIKGEYTDTEDKTNSYRSYAENILNVDGENIGTVSVSVENNIFGSPISQKDSYNNETRVEYDELNRPIKYIGSNGAERTIEYDNVNKTAILTDENGIKIKYIYDSLGNILKKQKYHNGTYNTFEEYTYDEYQRPLTAKINTTADDGTVSYYTYDDSDRVTQALVKDFSDTLIRTENYSYSTSNGIYKTTKTVTGAASETIASTTQGVDKNGNVVLESQTGEDETISVTYTYDYLNRRTSATDAKGNTTTFTYDTLGNVIKQTDALGNETVFDYDLGSRLISQTDALGNTSEFFYDGLSRKVKDVLPFDGETKSISKTYYDKNSNVIKQAVQDNKPGEAEHFRITEFKYDSMGNVTANIGRSENGDSVVQYEYNLANKPTKMITGLSEYSENQTGGNVTSYTYQDGFLMRITDPLGQSESYTYDWLGNMLSKTDRNNVTHTYDYGIFGLEETTSGTLKSETTYDNLGRVINQSQYTSDTLSDSTAYTYDVFGRVTSETQGNITKEYAYDANSNLTSYILKENGEAKTQNTYSYNSLNQLTNQTIDDTIVTYQYNPLGNLTVNQIGDYTVNYQYNDGQMLLNKEYLRNGSIQDYTGYTYSLDGNRITSESYQERKEYEYDDLGRLVQEISEIDRYVGGYGTLETNDTYTYDNRGNRLTKTSNGAVTEYKYDANNRLTEEFSQENGSIAYYYDANGNTISTVKGIYTTEGTPSMSLTAQPIGISYTYDELNRLIGVTESGKNVSYTYGTDNLRKSKTVNGITTGFIWNGSDMVAETNENGIFKIHSYTLDGIAKTTQNDEDRFYLKNGHGDVRWTIYDNGELNRGYYYDAFGNLLWSYQTNQEESSIDDNMFGYAGEYLDEETDLIYLRNRYYNTSNGRFITEDPIKDGLNWYVYCGGNPVMMIDPLGFDAIVITNKNSVPAGPLGSLGHTSAIYQNEDGDWFYTYWGDKAAAVIRIPDTYVEEWRRNGDVTANSMDSLSDFNNALNKFLSANGFKNITSNYTDATYIVGDFTASLDAAYDDVDSAYNNWFSEGTLTTLEDGSKVFQGHNSPYNPGYRNCFDKTYASLSKGILTDGTNVGDYMRNLGFNSGMIPNENTANFVSVFMNDSFTYDGSYSDVLNYVNRYSPWIQTSYKSIYANTVIKK